MGTGFSVVGINLSGTEPAYLHQILSRIKTRGSVPPHPNLSLRCLQKHYLCHFPRSIVLSLAFLRWIKNVRWFSRAGIGHVHSIMSVTMHPWPHAAICQGDRYRVLLTRWVTAQDLACRTRAPTSCCIRACHQIGWFMNPYWLMPDPRKWASPVVLTQLGRYSRLYGLSFLYLPFQKSTYSLLKLSQTII